MGEIIGGQLFGEAIVWAPIFQGLIIWGQIPGAQFFGGQLSRGNCPGEQLSGGEEGSNSPGEIIREAIVLFPQTKCSNILVVQSISSLVINLLWSGYSSKSIFCYLELL